ncbi:MAG TPA: protein-L-isoaspartate(D-aspartate) O-methyltransferase [Gemmatimonadales bacterium]|nr:protein-L-isoaspartate(D-aspartate) O-methyltransferase [Gemmatimonadales bacterium]
MPRQAHPAPTTRGPRTRMVMRQLAGRGVRDQRVLAAMRWTPREWFLPPHLAPDAYSDAPLPIGSGQTISQPYVVALMTERLQPRRTHRILEIGTGSGYQTAILAYLAGNGTIFTIERLPDLLVEAEERFRRLGLTNIKTRLGDGAAGWPEEAPFDGIIVAAAAPRIPEPLTAQLAPGGRLIIPVGDLASQELVILERPATGEGLVQRQAGGVRFVPLISRLAFTEEY